MALHQLDHSHEKLDSGPTMRYSLDKIGVHSLRYDVQYVSIIFAFNGPCEKTSTSTSKN